VTLAAFYRIDATDGGRNLSDHSQNLVELVLRNRKWGDADWNAACTAIEAQNARDKARRGGDLLCPWCVPSSPSCLIFQHKGHDGRTKVTRSFQGAEKIAEAAG